MNDYKYYTGSHKQASNYKKTTEFLINYVKGEKAYKNDIAESIQNAKYADTSTWYPRLEINTEIDPDRTKAKDTELHSSLFCEVDLLSNCVQILVGQDYIE